MNHEEREDREGREEHPRVFARFAVLAAFAVTC